MVRKNDFILEVKYNFLPCYLVIIRKNVDTFKFVIRSLSHPLEDDCNPSLFVEIENNLFNVNHHVLSNDVP
jgi:hypothetical protein